MQNTELHLGNPCNQLAMKLIFANSPHSLIATSTSLKTTKYEYLATIFPICFVWNGGRSPIKSRLRLLHHQSNSCENKYLHLHGTQSASMSKTPLQSSRPATSRSSMPAQLKRQSPRSSFTLNLMDMDSQALRNLPPSLRPLECHNNYHARCFIKAALAGSRTGDYSWAEGIANSQDKNHWKSPSIGSIH